MNSTYIQERIIATKLQITAYEDAALALGGDDILSYTIDTGQTRQTVTKADMKNIQNTIDTLYNRLVTLEARLNGGSVIARPCF